MKKIAIMGYGTVGSGVHEVLVHNADIIEERANEKITVKHILDVRDFSGHEFAQLFTNDFNKIINDSEISIVVECIGGMEPAYTFTKRALQSGKSVVTSNKELVASKGDELMQIAKDNNAFYLFEASVGGGIPIIRPLTTCLAGNHVYEISGILNGTTNYILTRMVDMGVSFEDALSKAQELGYAERNPEADVEGHDACRKIAILASLASGRHLKPETISTEGISNITLDDTSYARYIDMEIKLIGHAKIDGEKMFARVSPMMIPQSAPLNCAKDVFNAISVSGEEVGEVMFYGRGAGKLPTASAVVGDVIDIVRGISERKRITWKPHDEKYVVDINDTFTNAFIRVKSDFAEETAEMFESASLIDAGIDGERGVIIKNVCEAELAEKISKINGFIKMIRMA